MAASRRHAGLGVIDMEYCVWFELMSRLHCLFWHEVLITGTGAMQSDLLGDHLNNHVFERSVLTPKQLPFQ